MQPNKIKPTLFSSAVLIFTDSTTASKPQPSSSAVEASAAVEASTALSTHSLPVSSAQQSSAAFTTCCAGTAACVASRSAASSFPRKGSDLTQDEGGDRGASVDALSVATAASARFVRSRSRDRDGRTERGERADVAATSVAAGDAESSEASVATPRSAEVDRGGCQKEDCEARSETRSGV